MSAAIEGLELPAGVSFDGLWAGIPLAAFTDRDPASSCFGASFNLPLSGLTSEALLAKRTAKQREFAQAKVAIAIAA